MLIAEILRREAYQSVIETVDTFFERFAMACGDTRDFISKRESTASSLKQRAESFYDSVSRFGFLSTMSFYMYKAVETYSSLSKIFSAAEEQKPQRSGREKEECEKGDYGYSLFLRAFFDYLESLSRKSEIPEICSLVQKIMPCKPREVGDLAQMLRNLLKLEPRETDLLYMVIKAFSEASKTVSTIYSKRFEKS